ncbi:hypothetical protein, partial [Faecalibacterium prausnitzii]|uniref:hypothetical protein n=1 Tax=Faecalibacterium prausnitzii TaxID=853 RepID=UPI001A9A4589
LVLCDFSADAPLARALAGRASGADLRSLPRSDARAGARCLAHAEALLELVRETAAAAPALIRLVLPADDDGALYAALAALLRLREAYPAIDGVRMHNQRFGVLRWGDEASGGVDINMLRSWKDIRNDDMWTTTF